MHIESMIIEVATEKSGWVKCTIQNKGKPESLLAVAYVHGGALANCPKAQELLQDMLLAFVEQYAQDVTGGRAKMGKPIILDGSELN